MDAITPADIWDPRTWVPCDHEFRIYGSEDLELYAVVDEIDYAYLTQWRWSPLYSRNKKKLYLKRTVTVFHGPDGSKYESPVTGKIVRNRQRTTYTRFLHTEVITRAGVIKPTPKHVCDHKNGDGLNCRRENLHWLTHKENMASENVARKRRSMIVHEQGNT